MRPAVDHIYPFEQAPDALCHLQNGCHLGEVVIAL